jgi:hypothetical protein
MLGNVLPHLRAAEGGTGEWSASEPSAIAGPASSTCSDGKVRTLPADVETQKEPLAH